jgi:hypothetical protein
LNATTWVDLQCDLDKRKLDEEKLKHPGLAQQNEFGPCIFAPMLVKGNCKA